MTRLYSKNDNVRMISWMNIHILMVDEHLHLELHLHLPLVAPSGGSDKDLDQET
jgi:hypothetical protein